MLRAAFIAAVAFAACASALAEERLQPEQRAAEDEAQQIRRDGFVWSNDACGASRYAHLVGERYAELHHASLLPADSKVLDPRRLTTLEFRPGQLNVIVNGEGRVVTIGCF